MHYKEGVSHGLILFTIKQKNDVKNKISNDSRDKRRLCTYK